VLDAGVITKALDGWCTVPGHRAAGMTMRIVLGNEQSSPAPKSSEPGTGMADMPGMSSSTASAGPDAVSSNLAGTPPDSWRPIDATLAPVGPGTVHNVTWDIKDVKLTVAPGVTQTMWTFDGTVPGPVLHGHVGDAFNVTVHNDTAMTHNIDFHAEEGPPAAVMTPIAPGASHTYHFVAKHAGAWLYHCAVEPMLMHMGNGMYGALIIDPPDLAPAAEQYVLVGSELFFGPQGGVGDYAKMLADEPDAVVFNGFPFAYQHVPLQAHVGDRVRVWVVDAGPTRSLAFHVVGAPFDTTYLDGAYTLRAGNVEHGGAQTLPVDPGDGGFVEFTFTQAGSYPFLTHAMADAVIGASGTFDVSE
jgi:nitrite reductase (NO-forming)